LVSFTPVAAMMVKLAQLLVVYHVPLPLLLRASMVHKEFAVYIFSCAWCVAAA
jgi:hypothetical protein